MRGKDGGRSSVLFDGHTGGFGFQDPDSGFVVDHLALKVAAFDFVVVDYAQSACIFTVTIRYRFEVSECGKGKHTDSRSCQVHDRGRT